MNNCKIKNKDRTDDRYINIIIHIGETIVLLIVERLDDLVVNVLLEFTDALFFVLKDFSQIRIIASLPLGIPRNLEHFVLSYEIPMNIAEMEDIGPIFRDILGMTHDVMNGLASILKLGYPLLIVEHHEIGFYIRISVNPYIDESIDFLCDVFSLLRVSFSLLPMYLFALLLSKIIIILN